MKITTAAIAIVNVFLYIAMNLYLVPCIKLRENGVVKVSLSHLSLLSFFVRGLAQSIDFTGGRNYVVQFEKSVQPEDVRGIIAEAFPDCTTGALSLGTDNKTIRISTNYKIESNNPAVDDEAETILYNALKKANLVSQKSVEDFKNPDIRQGGSIISSSKVGPSVAKDITNGAIISVIIALAAIFLYILVRARVWLIESLNTFWISCLGCRRRFSRIRSNTTTLSLIE